MRLGAILVLSVFIAVSASPAQAEEKLHEGLKAEVDTYLAAAAGETELTARWENGLHFRSRDGSIHIHLGGRLLVDTAWQSSNTEFDFIVGEGAGEDATFVRQARFRVEGFIYRNNTFRVEYDFADSETVDIVDAWFGMDGLKYFPHLRIGNQKVPQSLEFMMSLLDVAFLERSAATNAFIANRQIGFAVYNHRLEPPHVFGKSAPQSRRGFHHLTLAFGIFRPTESGSAKLVSDSGVSAAGRISYLLLNHHTRRGRKMLHVGASYLYTVPPNGTVEYSAHGTIADGPNYIDTGPIPASYAQVMAGEIAYVLGPLSIQGEAFFTKVEGVAANPDFWGGYIYISYTLTGESRNYRGEEQGTLGRVHPWQNFLSGDEGFGAIDLAVRFERTDLKDAGVDGGIWTALTFGVNWYWNSNTRVALNYVTGVLEEGALDDGTIDALMLRFQVSW